MDEYSEFASDDFDVKGWINATVVSHLQLQQQAAREGESEGADSPALYSSLAHSGLDTHLSTVASKLQAVSASINAGLEKSMIEVMVSVPRVVTEVERVEAAIKTLNGELMNLSGQLEEIDHGANAHVETLARLDLVKTNMGNCLHTLTEAASWNALVREVNASFAQDDLKGVAQRLEAMVGSMDVLKDMPEAVDRAATLRDLQERLEALLKPKLQEILKKERMGPLVEYAAMYRQLGRTDVFRGDYCKARAAAAHKRWFASASSSSTPGGGVVEAGATGGGLATWLPSFLEYLQGSLMDERKRTSDLFGADTSPAVVCQLVVAAFQPLLGSFQKHLEAAPWRDAVGLLAEVLRFVGQALELARGAIERDLLAVLLASTAGFRPIQDRFGEHERRHLSSELSPLLETLASAASEEGGRGQASAMSFTRRMEEISDVSTKGFAVVQQSAGRCTELTAGYQGRDLLREAAAALCAFLKAVRDASKQTRSLGKGLLTHSGSKVENGVSNSETLSAAASGPSDAFSGEGSGVQGFHDGGGGDSGDFDWQYLQGALVLLGAAGRCQRCFADVEKELASALLRDRTGLFAASAPRLSSLALPAQASSSSRSSTNGGNGGLASENGGGVSSSGLDGGSGGISAATAAGGGSEEGRVVVLRTLLARVRLEEDRAARAETRAGLMALVEPSSAVPGDVLPAPAREVRALAADARSLVFDVCFKPVTTRLNTVPSLPSWREEKAGGGGGFGGWGADVGDDADDYDTVPQAYMTQVGEHLLSLLQNLEPFAGSDAFRDAVEPTQDLHLLTDPAWRDCGLALDLGETDLALLETLSGAKPSHDRPEEAMVGGDGDQEEEEEEGEAAKFCTSWLVCVGSATVGCLLAKVLSLPKLSERGVKHLDADVKYLSNVFHALDLPAPPILEHLSLLAALDRDHAAAHLAQETVADYGAAGVVLDKLERWLAEARGIDLP
ncbi:unnamed protein product [Scytosiphon promiscuus]